MSGENLSVAYEDYAIYLPSLQLGYAAYPLRDPSTVKLHDIPKGLQLSDLNFLSSASNLWHCKYTLYSAGQFNNATITTPDIVSARSKNTLIIGDSGGYQIGKGKLPAIQGWVDFQKSPKLFIASGCENAAYATRYCDGLTDIAITR